MKNILFALVLACTNVFGGYMAVHPRAYAASGGDVPHFGDLVLWYDASQETTYGNDDPVAQWTDWSGNDLHAVQTTAGLKPVYKTNVVNGLAAIYWAGSDRLDIGYGSKMLNISDQTYGYFAVWKASAGFLLFDDGAYGDYSLDVNGPAGGWGGGLMIYVGSGYGTYVYAGSDGEYTDGNPHAGYAGCEGEEAQYVKVGSDTGSDTNWASTADRGGFYMGCRIDGPHYSTGYVCEFLLYSVDCSRFRDDVLAYLKDKYGL